MARTTRRSTAAALSAALLATLLALAAPAAPAGAITLTQSGVKPSDSDCQAGRLHTSGTIGTCGGIDITGRILVNGSNVAANTALNVGDVITVSVEVAAQGGHDGMYAETVDGIRNNQYDMEALIPIGLPNQTGSLLSAPSAVTMGRTDNGDRGQGPAINCLAQRNQDAARTDAPMGITLGGAPAGQNGMQAGISGSTLTARWTTMSADRCVRVVSNNGIYGGHLIRFQQTVVARGATAQTPSWSLGGLTLALKNGSRSLTWGGAQSGALSIPAATVPSAPVAAPTATAGNGQATVTWAAPANNGGSPITGYRITPFIGATAQPAVNITGTGTSHTVPGLTNGTAYTFRVAATNAAGTGANSPASNAVTPTGVPAAPAAPTATAGNGQATVTWAAPANNGGSPITGYRITPYVGATAQPAVNVAGTGTTHTVPGLTNGTAYTFRVAATNAVGTGTDSPASNAVTPAGVPGAPSGVAASAVHSGANVTWTAPASNGGSAITGYVITPYIGATAQTPVVSTGAGTSRAVTGLQFGETYTFTVSATNAVGTGPASAASGSVTVAVPWAPFATAAAFTAQQFEDFAGRAPTAAELAAWETALVNGTSSASQLIETLRTAPYYNDTIGPIVRLYRSVYLRNPETAGLRYWEGELRSGRHTLNTAANFFARGPEFRALYGELNDTQFVTKVYQLVLERNPSQADLDYWTGELRRGQPRGRMVLLFSSSAEYRNKTADRVAVIQIQYGLLDRVGTNAEVNAALAAIDGGATYADIVAEVLASPEYAARVL